MDGIFANRWAGSGRLLLRPLPAELQGRDRAGAAARLRRPRSRSRASPRVAQGAVDGAVEALGRDHPGASTRTRASSPTARPTWRARASWRRFSSPTIRRGAVSRRRGRTATARSNTARSWAAGRSAASSASASRSPIAGRTPCRASRKSGFGSRRDRERQRPWVTKFSGVLYDRRWLPMVERIYQWHARHERYLRNEVPLARVALLHSEQTATFHPGVARRRSRRRSRARDVPALIEASVPFEMVHEAFLTPDRIDAVQAADPRRRGGSLRRAVRGHSRVVERGGSLLATFAASLYDELGRPARRFRARGRLSGCRSAAGSTGRCRTPT